MLLAVSVAPVAYRLLRGLVSPPLAWDALLYHGYKPAVWVQTGSATLGLAPDQWSYLEFFPHGAQIPWGWAMLVTHDDALIAPTSGGVWLLCGIGAFGLARAFGAPRTNAAFAALATAMLPAAANQSASAYGDTHVLAVFLLGFVFLTRLYASPTPGDAVLALAAFGLTAAAKLSGPPTLLLGAVLVAVALGRSRRPHAARFATLAAALTVALVVALPSYLHAFRVTGSFTYPLPLTLLGHTVWSGNEELSQLYSGELLGAHDRPGDLLRLARVLVFSPATPPRHEHLGFGLGAPALALLGLRGAFHLLEARRHRFAVVALIAFATLPALVLLTSPSFLAHRTLWRYGLGRLLLPLPAALAALGATAPGRVTRPALAAIILLDVVALVPRGTSAPALHAVVAIAPWLLLALALGGAVFYAARRKGHILAGVVAGPAVTGLVLGSPLADIREASRSPIYAALTASEQPAYEMHSIDPRYAAAWPVWRYLDDDLPRRLAVTGGWDGVGHNMLRYPLLGSRLQNTIQYVPITHDGAIIDYRTLATVRERLDPRAWLQRLVDERIDVVVTLAPAPPERLWIQRAQGAFTLAAEDATGSTRAYVFHPDRARALLEGRPSLPIPSDLLSP